MLKYTYIKCSLLLWSTFCLNAQTTVSGKVLDESQQALPFTTISFPDSTEGTMTDIDGNFYLESEQTYSKLKISFLGYKEKIIALENQTEKSLVINLMQETQQLNDIVIYKDKTSKKENPALRILRNIWKTRKRNGLKQVNQYQYQKYEKLEFDMNSIDSSFIKNPIFKGMEFIFEQIDTSSITGKNYLPIYLNESIYEIYGDNTVSKEKEILKGNKNAGFGNNPAMIASIKELYADYNIYDNYLRFFSKNFTSPLSKRGINTYNYVLADSTFINDKWCYNIVYYPRRKNELTFKGDFWVNDTTWAIKDINLSVAKKANMNWIRDLYIEQEFELVNDSIFLIKKDFFQSDFALSKKEGTKGIYGKRTTMYDQYVFDQPKKKKFYNKRSYNFDPKVYHQDDEFWQNVRHEGLNKDELKVYKLLDTLKTVKSFKRMHRFATVLASQYYELPNFDFGPVFNTIGYNQIEGLRLRLGGRTYFSQNDRWRIQGFGAYGFKDKKFKYGISGKILLDPKSRLTAVVGYRKDLEQLGASLSNTANIEARNLASSALVPVGDNTKLTRIELTGSSISVQPKENLQLTVSASWRNLKPGDRNYFKLDFIDPDTQELKTEITQTQISTNLTYTPGRKTSGYGVEPVVIKARYPTLFLNYSRGIKGVLNSDFNFDKIQLYYKQPFDIGGLGRMTTSVEAGKTFGNIPLGLLSVIPGNQTYFSVENTFPLLNFYEFVTDTYATAHLEHNFNGRILSKIPLLRKLKLREIIGLRAAWGNITQDNLDMSQTSGLVFQTPDKQLYYEYSLGIANILRILRLDFHFRGNYLDAIDARKFGVTASFKIDF